MLVAILSPCLAPVSIAQEESASEQPDKRFFETVQVNVVNIEVFVEGKRGKPVKGLTKEDFELYVDERQVPISNFYAASSEVLRAEAEAPRRTIPEEPVSSAPAEQQPSSGASDQDLNLIFYIDNFNLRPTDRNRVLRRLTRFVAQNTHPGTRMMLVSYDRSLHVRQDLTTDPRRVIDAALEVEELAGLATSRDADRRLALTEIDEADSASEALVAASAYADARQTELQLPLSALTELMEPLGGLTGRKALVYVSSGLPKRVGEDLFHMVELRFQRSRARMRSFLHDMTRDHDRLVRAANASGVTIYALDAGGLSSFDSLSAAEGGSVEGGSFVAVDSVRQANLQAPLIQMATETGGIALTNSNNVDLLFDRLREDLTSYYSLGYRAAPTDTGRYRDLEVKVKRPGVRVRHRDGFRVQSLERRLEQGVMAALTMGQQGNRFGVRLVAGQPASNESGNLRVPVDVQIPLGKVTLVPDGDQWLGRVLVLVRSTDGDGGLSPMARSEPLEIRIPDSEYQQALEQHITWTVELVMRPGRQRLAIGLADLLGGQLGYTTTYLDPGRS